MIDGLLAALDRADLDATVKVVTLRGAGKDFCAGMDLNELLASADRSVSENRAAALHFGEIFIHPDAAPAETHRRAGAGTGACGGVRVSYGV
jgi:enoyl-CoA hydratase